MTNLSRKVELISNIAIIAVSLLFGGVIIKRYILPNAAPAPPVAIASGTKVSLPDIDWQKNQRTLLLALSTTCRFCTESAEFYQRLAQQTLKQDNIRIVAVLPQPAAEASTYLNTLGVHIKDVKQVPLSSIEVKVTPTLILVDDKGLVANVWIGKLSPDKESDVLNKIQ